MTLSFYNLDDLFFTNNNIELDKAYWLLQDLYYISIFSSYETIYKDLNEWFDKVNESDIREFKKVMTTYREWFKEIRNSFLIDDITKKRLTNGFIEGKNNICKVIKRVGFGYKKFDNLRNRILYENKELIIQKKYLILQVNRKKALGSELVSLS